MKTKSAILLLLALSPPVHALVEKDEAYVNPPKILEVDVDNAVTDMLTAKNPTAIAAVWNKLVVFTVSDALLRRNESDMVDMSRFLAETARTDKQTGGSSTSSGSTTLVEKPGLPALLALAVEHGGIQQEVDGTNLTLSFSPAGLLQSKKKNPLLPNPDGQFGRRFSLSVTFNLENAESASVADASPQQITEASARFRMLGNRSGGSTSFEEQWREVVQPKIQQRVNELSGAVSTIPPTEFEKWQATKTKTQEAIAAWFESRHPVLSEEERTSQLKELILGVLWSDILVPVRDTDVKLPEKVEEKLRPLLETLDTLAEQEAVARDSLDDLLDVVNRKPLLTAELTSHRSPIGFDYSELKLLFERQVSSGPRQFSIVANAGYSMYHDPEPAMNQSDTRDYHLSFSLEGSSESPLQINPDDLSRITYSFSGKFNRFEEMEADMAIAMLRVEIPISGGMALPLSVSWANRTEFIDEDDVRGHIGVSFDMDKLFAMSRALLKGSPATVLAGNP